MPTNIVMPQMGESVVEGTVSRWLKQEGEAVDQFEPLLEVETDKVTSEIPSPASGVLLKVYVPEGQTVAAGTLLALVGQPDENIEEPGRGTSGHVPREAHGPPAEAVASNGGAQTTHVTPVVARIAAEHGIDVRHVRGTGHDGRVTKKDILAYIDASAGRDDRSVAPASVEEELAPWERPGSGDLFKPTDDLYKKQTPTTTTPGKAAQTSAPAPTPPALPRTAPASAPGELLPHTPMRRRIAEHMVRSKLHTAPHVTTVFEADMTAVAAHREMSKLDLAQRGINLTYTAYFVAATAQALRQHPRVNSQWTDDGLLLKRDINIGVAVALDEGLIVPVIRRADELSLAGLARQVTDLATRARTNALNPEEVSGGTFTITNHGVSGSLFATPIISQPQTAILGVGAIQKRVMVLKHDTIGIRPMVYLSLTFDHRVLDGASADWFLAEIVKTLEGWDK